MNEYGLFSVEVVTTLEALKDMLVFGLPEFVFPQLLLDAFLVKAPDATTSLVLRPRLLKLAVMFLTSPRSG